MVLLDLEDLGVALVNYEEDLVHCRAVFSLLAPAAIFRDHFPGRPLLPAIGLLYLCDWMIRRWRGGNVRIASLRRVKLTAPVYPGVHLQIELTRTDSLQLSMVARSESAEYGSGDLCIRDMPPHETDAS